MTVRKLRFLAFGGIALGGCNDAPAPPPAAESAVTQTAPALPVPAPPATGKGPAVDIQTVPQPAPVEPAAKLPDDLGGKAVQKVLGPAPAMTGDSLASKAPRPRSTEFDRAEWPSPVLAVRLPATPNPKVKPAKPSLPPERAPTDLGQAATQNLSAVKFADRPLARAETPANSAAADLPPMARQQTERVSLEDPTAELSASKVIDTLFPVPVGTLPFLKLSIPDPFEYAEQLKGKLPRSAEFGTAPAVVPPEKK